MKTCITTSETATVISKKNKRTVTLTCKENRNSAFVYKEGLYHDCNITALLKPSPYLLPFEGFWPIKRVCHFPVPEL
jgi:hypothetical protein